MNKRWWTFLLLIVGNIIGIGFIYHWSISNTALHNYFRLPTLVDAGTGWHRLYNGTKNKWIVVTSSPGSNDVIQQLCTIPGWNVVVVGDNECPPERMTKNCFAVSINNLPRPLLNSFLVTTDNNYSLKNLGYLFAIRKGAAVIYDTEGDVKPLKGLKDFSYNQIFVGLQYSGKQFVFNSFRHFGRSTPQRGFPLEYKAFDANTFRLGNFNKPLIQQALINSEADIKPVLKLDFQTNQYKNNVISNTAAPPVIVKNGVFSPFNSKNTLFHYDALWALLLPVTLSRSTGDIVRSYWSQRLLWEIKGTVGFLPPNSFRPQKKNDSDKTLFHFNIVVFINFLKEWTCPEKLPFFQCVLLLSNDMVDHLYWNIKDHQLIVAWIKQLQIAEYNEPRRKPPPPPAEYGDKVVFQPVEYDSSSNKPHYISKLNRLLAITKLCRDSSYQTSSSKLNKTLFPNILLIIIFNLPYYSNIPYLNMIYGVQFTHIVYCGSDINIFLNASKRFPDNVTFLEKDVRTGQAPHICISAAMKMNYNVDGYLAIGDDTLLNTWNIRSLPLNQIWFVGFTRLFRNETLRGWAWWQKPWHRAAFNKAWTEMLNMKKKSPQLNQTVTKFVNTLQNNTRSKMALYKGVSDIVYIPQKYRNKAILFLDLSEKHKVFQEVAVPTLVAGLCPLKDIVRLKGQYLWYGKRKQVPKLFNKDDIFMHPVKLSNIKDQLKHFYCKTFLPLL